MIVSLIAAISENRVLGREGDMPWHLPRDLKHFKSTTLGHPVIMGRKTFESFGGKPLKERLNIIVTRNEEYDPGAENTRVAYSLDEAIEVAKETGDNELFIIGGGEIYRQSMAIADKIYLTIIHETFEGDTFFPETGPENWKETKRSYFEPDEKNAYAMTFLELERDKLII